MESEICDFVWSWLQKLNAALKVVKSLFINDTTNCLKILNSFETLKCINFQENVLNFIYDAYNGESGIVEVPESLQMKKDLSNRREASELKAYRSKNRYYLKILVVYVSVHRDVYVCTEETCARTCILYIYSSLAML